METYHQLSDTTMNIMLENLEELLDNAGQSTYEIEYESGVLTLGLGDHGTYVINKQPPNKQIWLSSPFSGPKRYDYVPAEDDWRYSRDGSKLGELLNEELSRVFEKEVDLQLDHISEKVE